MRQYDPPHPGLLIKEEYIGELGLSVTKLAESLGVSRVTISEIINGKSRITAEMAVRLSKAFSTTPELWVNMQASYDLWQALQKINTDNIPVIYAPGPIPEEEISIDTKRDNAA